MKRLLFGGAVAGLLGVVAVFLFWQPSQIPIPATRLAPEDAPIFFQLPNIAQSRKRWNQTALAQLVKEPSVQRFLARPLGRLLKDYDTTRQALAHLRPNSIFFSASASNDKAWILGLQCLSDLKGWRRKVEGVVENTYGCRLAEVLPTTRSVNSPDSDAPVVYAQQIGNWLLFGQNVEILRGAAARFSQQKAGLERSPLFEQCAARLPSTYDFLTFFRGEALSADALPWKIPRDIDNVRAVIAATTIDGSQLRDTVFTCEKNPGARPPLDSRSLSAAGPAALFFGNFQLDLLHVRDLADRLSGRFAIADAAKGYFDEVTSAGISLTELSDLLQGVDFVLDRQPETDSLSLLFTATLRDSARFEDLIDKLFNAKFPGQFFKQEVAGLPAHIFRVNEATSLVIAVYGGRLYVVTSEPDFSEVLRRVRGQTLILASNKQFEAVRQLVSPPTDVFVYVDTKDLFEHLYAAARPMLMLGCALLPKINEYLDANALPETSEVSRHLSPIVFSRHRVPNGVLDESVGPITGYQASIVGLSAGFALGLFNPES
jgi:hypothetical protein